MMKDPLIEEKRRILEAALPSVPFDGWTDKTLHLAAVAAGYDETVARRAFPGGAVDLIQFFAAETDRRMVEKLEDGELDAMPIRERIAFAVRTRLQLQARHREAVRAALTLQAHPRFARRAMASLYRTVDAMWRAVGDTSTDFNFYTKRALLAGVYVTTLLHWINDQSDGFGDTWAFLDRRIADVMRIQKQRGHFDKLAECVPSPWRALGRLRYGLRHATGGRRVSPGL